MEQKTVRLTILIDVRKLIRQYLLEHGVTYRTQPKINKIPTGT